MNEVVFPSIDTSTLALARAIIQLTLAGLIIWTGNRQDQRSGAQWWAAGLALHGIGLLFFLVHFGPLDSLIATINHLCFGFSSVCILVGVWQFGRQAPRYSWLLLLAAIPVSSVVLWEWWMPNARWRILFTASGQLLFLLILHRALATAPRPEMASIYRALRWIVGVYGVLLVWSYGSLAELLPTTARIAPGYHSVLFSFGSMLFMLALAVSFLALQYAQVACTHADQARTDWLTGLLNRRGLRAAVDDRYGLSRSEPALSVLALDVDHFKTINDRHGHAAGDRVLKTLARELTARTGRSELLARVGGEEFQLLLPVTDAPAAMRFAESLRQACESLTIDADTGAARITVSIGVAVQRRGEVFEQTANRADQALYRAKRCGRNRVVLAPSEVPPVDPRVPAYHG